MTWWFNIFMGSIAVVSFGGILALFAGVLYLAWSSILDAAERTRR